MTTLGLEYLKHQENMRHNTVAENETERSNKERERVNALTLEETIRSNKAREFETARSNRARETETNRANLVSEGQNKARFSEEARHNKQQEDISLANLMETRHHNRNQERADMAKSFGNAVNPVMAAAGASLVDAYDLGTEASNAVSNISLSEIGQALDHGSNFGLKAIEDVTSTAKMWWDQGPGELLSDLNKAVQWYDANIINPRPKANKTY